MSAPSALPSQPPRLATAIGALLLTAGLFAPAGATGVEGVHWVPGLGDPTWVSWGLSGLSCAAAVLCILNARRAPPAPSGHPAVWWALAGLLLGTLALTQAGLHGWFAQAGRGLAQEQGWYAWRRWLQGGVIAGLLLGGGLLLRGARARLGPHWPAHRFAVHAGTWLGVFIAVRAVSFHPVDALLRAPLAGLSTNAWIEAVGLACLWTGAWVAWRRQATQANLEPSQGSATRTG